MSISRKRSHSINAWYENNTCVMRLRDEELFLYFENTVKYIGDLNDLDMGCFYISFCCLDPLMRR